MRKMHVEMARIMFGRILFRKLVKSIKIFYFDVKREDWKKYNKLALKKIFLILLYGMWYG